jgi:hypothetical protein
MKPWVTVTAATVVLITALSGCGNHREDAGAPVAGARPPDCTLPYLEPDPASTVPVTDLIELIIEERRPRPDGAPVDMSQLVVLTSLNQEFLAQASWNSRHIQIRGKAHVMERDILMISYSFTIRQVRGPLSDTVRGTSTLHLKPQTKYTLAGWANNLDSDPKLLPTIEVWFRPHVTKAP